MWVGGIKGEAGATNRTAHDMRDPSGVSYNVLDSL